MECHPKTLLVNSSRLCVRVAVRNRSTCTMDHTMQPTIDEIELPDPNAYRLLYQLMTYFANFSFDSNCYPVAIIDLNLKFGAVWTALTIDCSANAFVVTLLADNTVDDCFVEYISMHLMLAIDSNCFSFEPAHWNCFPQNNSIFVLSEKLKSNLFCIEIKLNLNSN